MDKADKAAVKHIVNEAVEEIAIVTDKAIKHEVGALRQEMHEMGRDIRQEMHEMKTELKEEMQEMKGDIQILKKDIQGVKDGQESILRVVSSIDERLAPLIDLPARATRLERAVFKR